MLLQLDGIARHLADRTLFADASLLVNRGDRVGLVGPNGAGKTTLLRIVAGEETPDAGRVTTRRGVRVGMLRQEIDPDRDATPHDEVASALAALDALEAEMRSLEAEMKAAGERGQEVPPEVAERWDEARAAFEFGGGFEREARVDRILEGLGFDAERRVRPLRSFSGGWLMRVELAKLLLAAPDVLLLDEPTNHLDLPSIQWFEETLAGYRGAVIVISHDRTFLRRHATRIAELEHGRFDVYEGGWDRYLAEKALRHEQLLARKRQQDRKIAQQERFIERFRYKNTKARQVQSRVKALEKLERVELPEDRRRSMRLRLPDPVRAGEVVLALEGVHKSYGENAVYRGVDLQVRRGERVALVGPNGAGKSTLLRIAAGALDFDAGERRLGHNATAAFYAQHQLEVLDPARTVLEELERVATTDDHARLRGHLGAFLFTGDDVDKKVSVLSGGEKARLALARMLLRPANFLVLDEPTNHLDIAACEVLEQALGAYRGTLLLISHDRSLINALATRIVEVRDGTLREFTGNYDDYLGRREDRPDAGSAPRTQDAPPPEPEAATATPRPERTKQQRMAARARDKERTRRLARARRRLASTEDEIAERERTVESLGHRLGDPEVYKDGDAVRRIEAERQEAQRAVDELYREWERIAAELESIEQGPEADA